MTIQEIISALQGHGVNATASQLEAFLAAQNTAAADVTPDMVALIAEEMKPKGLAVAAKGGKATTKRKKGSAEQAAQPVETLQTALTKAAKNTGVEIGAMLEAVDSWSDQTALSAGTEIYNRIKSTSGKTVLEIARLAAEDTAEPDHFRNALGDILSSVELPV